MTLTNATPDELQMPPKTCLWHFPLQKPHLRFWRGFMVITTMMATTGLKRSAIFAGKVWPMSS